jgi:hypothetical protein
LLDFSGIWLFFDQKRDKMPRFWAKIALDTMLQFRRASLARCQSPFFRNSFIGSNYKLEL